MVFMAMRGCSRQKNIKQWKQKLHMIREKRDIYQCQRKYKLCWAKKTGLIRERKNGKQIFMISQNG